MAADHAAAPGHARDRIRHIIVLMLENRSFDHLLGYLQHEDPDYPRLDHLDVSCPVDPGDPDGELVSPSPDATSVLGTDPAHSHEAVMLQVYGGAGPGRQPLMNGFIRSYALKIGGQSLRPTSRLLRALDAIWRGLSWFWRWLMHRPIPAVPDPRDIMRCFAEAEAPVLSRLAKDFAVCVNWHASVPGETWPNRNYAHAATSDGTTNIDLRFYDDETIFERLEDVELRWGVYQDGIAQVWAFWKLWADSTDNFHEADVLLDHIRADRLPAYAFVEPNHGYGRGEGNSQHPGNNLADGASFVAGEVLMGSIYNELVRHPEVFAKTMFLITYDEHGGFFDHVPPPAAVPPDDKVAPSGFDFTTCGVRVPAVVVSPLVPRGTVDHHCYEHATIPRTVRAQFAPEQPQLTGRDGAAEDLLANLPLLDVARTDLTELDLPLRPLSVEVDTAQTLSEFEASLLELAGAVKTQTERTDLAQARMIKPPFVVDPALASAARARVLVPGSPASQAADEVVARFVAPSRPDPRVDESGW